jgi:hypothetical protein
MMSPFNSGNLDTNAPSIPTAMLASLSQGPQPMGNQDAQSVGINYNNSQAATAVNNALQGDGGHGANNGLYGLLPQSMQHGTLRNFLGALGDAFLVGSGHQPQYQPRMDRQAMGNAMAGMNINDPSSVAAAVQRIAATGAPGAAELADKVQQQAEQAALRQQYMQYNQDYREQITGAKDQNILARRSPAWSGFANSAPSNSIYSQRFAQAEAAAQKLGKDYHAEDFGLLPPDQWQPGMTAQGLTSNQQQVSSDKAAQRQTSERETDVNAKSRLGAAGINAGGHIAAAGVSNQRPSPTTLMQQLEPIITSGKANPAQQALWNKLTETKNGRALPPGLTIGKQPTSVDRNYLLQHPQMRSQFDAHFGNGASAQILGH